MYVVGGWDVDYLDSLEIYSVQGNTWRSGTPLPSPLANGALVRAGARLLLLGGNTNVRDRSEVCTVQ